MHGRMVGFNLQQLSKVCIQTFALLYIAAFPCIPNCLGNLDSSNIGSSYSSSNSQQQILTW